MYISVLTVPASAQAYSSFARSPIRSLSIKVPGGLLNISEPQAHSPITILYRPRHRPESCMPQHSSPIVSANSTQQRRQPLQPHYIHGFQGNNAAEPKVILSQVCIRPGLTVILYLQPVG